MRALLIATGLFMLQNVQTMPTRDEQSKESCIEITLEKEKEIESITSKLKKYLTTLALEYENYDIRLLKLQIEKHSDDEVAYKDTTVKLIVNDCADFNDTGNTVTDSSPVSYEEVDSRVPLDDDESGVGDEDYEFLVYLDENDDTKLNRTEPAESSTSEYSTTKSRSKSSPIKAPVEEEENSRIKNKKVLKEFGTTDYTSTIAYDSNLKKQKSLKQYPKNNNLENYSSEDAEEDDVDADDGDINDENTYFSKSKVKTEASTTEYSSTKKNENKTLKKDIQKSSSEESTTEESNIEKTTQSIQNEDSVTNTNKVVPSSTEYSATDTSIGKLPTSTECSKTEASLEKKTLQLILSQKTYPENSYSEENSNESSDEDFSYIPLYNVENSKERHAEDGIDSTTTKYMNPEENSDIIYDEDTDNISEDNIPTESSSTKGTTSEEDTEVIADQYKVKVGKTSSELTTYENTTQQNSKKESHVTSQIVPQKRRKPKNKTSAEGSVEVLEDIVTTTEENNSKVAKEPEYTSTETTDESLKKRRKPKNISSDVDINYEEDSDETSEDYINKVPIESTSTNYSSTKDTTREATTEVIADGKNKTSAEGSVEVLEDIVTTTTDYYTNAESSEENNSNVAKEPEYTSTETTDESLKKRRKPKNIRSDVDINYEEDFDETSEDYINKVPIESTSTNYSSTKDTTREATTEVIADQNTNENSHENNYEVPKDDVTAITDNYNNAKSSEGNKNKVLKELSSTQATDLENSKVQYSTTETSDKTKPLKKRRESKSINSDENSYITSVEDIDETLEDNNNEVPIESSSAEYRSTDTTPSEATTKVVSDRNTKKKTYEYKYEVPKDDVTAITDYYNNAESSEGDNSKVPKELSSTQATDLESSEVEYSTTETTDETKPLKKRRKSKSINSDENSYITSVEDIDETLEDNNNEVPIKSSSAEYRSIDTTTSKATTKVVSDRNTKKKSNEYNYEVPKDDVTAITDYYNNAESSEGDNSKVPKELSSTQATDLESSEVEYSTTETTDETKPLKKRRKSKNINSDENSYITSVEDIDETLEDNNNEVPIESSSAEYRSTDTTSSEATTKVVSDRTTKKKTNEYNYEDLEDDVTNSIDYYNNAESSEGNNSHVRKELTSTETTNVKKPQVTLNKITYTYTESPTTTEEFTDKKTQQQPQTNSITKKNMVRQKQTSTIEADEAESQENTSHDYIPEKKEPQEISTETDVNKRKNQEHSKHVGPKNKHSIKETIESEDVDHQKVSYDNYNNNASVGSCPTQDNSDVIVLPAEAYAIEEESGEVILYLPSDEQQVLNIKELCPDNEGRYYIKLNKDDDKADAPDTYYYVQDGVRDSTDGDLKGTEVIILNEDDNAVDLIKKIQEQRGDEKPLVVFVQKK